MKYVSIDLETTGLDAANCQVLEFAAVLEDTLGDAKPVDSLPFFHTYVTRVCKTIGEPKALAMNARILERIADQEPGYHYTQACDLGRVFADWCRQHGLTMSLNAAGKNFGTFDLPFLQAIPYFSAHVQFSRRVIDPSHYFFDPLMDVRMPNTEVCCERAGIDANLDHTALADARRVVRLIRIGLTK